MTKANEQPALQCPTCKGQGWTQSPEHEREMCPDCQNPLWPGGTGFLHGMLSREQSEQVRWLWSPGQPAGGKPLTPRLAEEPSISPAEALSLKYWGEGLSPEFQIFWAKEVSESERNAIDAEAEDFHDREDYWNRKFSPELRTFLSEKLPALDVDAESIANIVIARAGEPEIRSNPAYATKCLRQIESLVRAAWGIDKAAAHRPVEEEAQHREWSRRKYLNAEYKDLAKEAGIGEEHVRTSVKRHRKRREDLQWLLRAAIYRVGHK